MEIQRGAKDFHTTWYSLVSSFVGLGNLCYFLYRYTDIGIERNTMFEVTCSLVFSTTVLALTHHALTRPEYQRFIQRGDGTKNWNRLFISLCIAVRKSWQALMIYLTGSSVMVVLFILWGAPYPSASYLWLVSFFINAVGYIQFNFLMETGELAIYCMETRFRKHRYVEYMAAQNCEATCNNIAPSVQRRGVEDIFPLSKTAFSEVEYRALHVVVNFLATCIAALSTVFLVPSDKPQLVESLWPKPVLVGAICGHALGSTLMLIYSFVRILYLRSMGLPTP